MPDIFDSANDAINQALVPPPGAPPPPAPPAAAPTLSPEDQAIAAINNGLANPTPPEKLQTWGQYMTDVNRNVGTSVVKGFAGIAGLPHLAGQAGDWVFSADEPGWISRHTYSPAELTQGAFNVMGRMEPNQPPPTPYEPTTVPGKIGSAAIQGGIAGLLGGPEGALARTVAGAGAGAGGEAYRIARPDDPWWAQLLASVGAGGVANAGTALAGWGARQAPGVLTSSTKQAEQTVANRLASTAGQSGSQIAGTIEANRPLWTPGTAPTTADVLENPGVRGMTYKDMVQAQRQDDAIYEQMARQTNQAQRAAVQGAMPADANAQLTQAIADRDAAVAAIPAGATQQEAGTAFRQNLQNVYDQRTATRAAGGGAFDALQDNPAHVSLVPLRDYATTMASKNAGEVGSAYQAAANQFRSATGITLDTADFANSARQGLGDLAGKYQPGSAGQRAVLDVKNQLEASLTEQVPEVGAAAKQWAQNSEPLDVFKAAPFSGVLARDRFNQRYLMPNDQVASAFLRGPGSADALDRLTGVFGDPETATRNLQDYIAGQVRDRAINADGSVNTAALQTVLRPYQQSLMRFPTLQRQFSTAEGAQQAVAQQQAYQQLYSRLNDQLGTQKLDAQGNAFYSPAAFKKFVADNSDLIDQAYTPEQAAVVRRVNDELQSMAQTPQSKVAGTSGTGQTMPSLGGHGAMAGFGGIGTVLGGIFTSYLGHGWELGALGGGSVGTAVGKMKEAQDALVASIQRQALTDPAYARSLMLRFDPSGVNTPAAQQAMRYVLQRTPALSAANSAAGP